MGEGEYIIEGRGAGEVGRRGIGRGAKGNEQSGCDAGGRRNMRVNNRKQRTTP